MSNIILFGLGKYFNHKISILDRYSISCIIDNAVSGESVHEVGGRSICICNPSCIDKSGTEQIFLMSMHFVSMWKQLVELGIDPSRIVYPYSEKPYFQSDYIIDECVSSIVFTDENIAVYDKDGTEWIITTEEEWYDCLRHIYRKRYPVISAISSMSTTPLSEQFATERGTPVDRYYIDLFLKNHKSLIKGDVLEVENNTYTQKYGLLGEFNSIVMDYSSKKPWVDFNADLESGKGIRDNIADCFILTQTLMYIFDVKSAAANIGRLLKKNGYALITCSGLSQNSVRCMDDYGSYFNFNPAVFRKMFEDEKNLDVLETGSYGNVKTVSAHIAGLCCEDLRESDFSYNDKHYPLIVYAVVKKNG